jgi:hypothetical protein
VASALDCQARTILQERQYRTHQIGPLRRAEQQQLIERYLGRFTKKLESALQHCILNHQLAGSPLFLKVLLEELRQCAWYDTLAEQLDFYLAAETIDDLYAKVLERLERDGHGEATRKALTALWASRAGLSEHELLELTGLAPLEWAPVDLALNEAFGQNEGRVVFDHDYLRLAAERRWLHEPHSSKSTRESFVKWFLNQREWDPRSCFEVPWQLLMLGHTARLRQLLKTPEFLSALTRHRGPRESYSFWVAVFSGDTSVLKKLLGGMFEDLSSSNQSRASRFRITESIARLLTEAGITDDLLLKIRKQAYRLCRGKDDINQGTALLELCQAYALCGYPHIRDRILSRLDHSSIQQKASIDLLDPNRIRERYYELAGLAWGQDLAKVVKQVEALMVKASHMLGHESLLHLQLKALHAACIVRQDPTTSSLRIMLRSIADIEQSLGRSHVSLIIPLGFLAEHYRSSDNIELAITIGERVALLSKQTETKLSHMESFRRFHVLHQDGECLDASPEFMEWFNAVFSMRSSIGPRTDMEVLISAAELAYIHGNRHQVLSLITTCSANIDPLNSQEACRQWLLCTYIQGACLNSLGRHSDAIDLCETAFDLIERQNLNVSVHLYLNVREKYVQALCAVDNSKERDVYGCIVDKSKTIDALFESIEICIEHREECEDRLGEYLSTAAMLIASQESEPVHERLNEIGRMISWFIDSSDSCHQSLATILALYEQLCSADLREVADTDDLLLFLKLVSPCFELVDEGLLLRESWARSSICCIREAYGRVLADLGLRSDAVMQFLEIARLIRHAVNPTVNDFNSLESAAWLIDWNSGGVRSDWINWNHFYLDIDYFELFR